MSTSQLIGRVALIQDVITVRADNHAPVTAVDHIASISITGVVDLFNFLNLVDDLDLFFDFFFNDDAVVLDDIGDIRHP